jgi:hypothetical protein
LRISQKPKKGNNKRKSQEQITMTGREKRTGKSEKVAKQTKEQGNTKHKRRKWHRTTENKMTKNKAN